MMCQHQLLKETNKKLPHKNFFAFVFLKNKTFKTHGYISKLPQF